MRTPVHFAVLAMLVVGVAAVGCKSSQEGVKTSYRTQWTHVDADTKTTTDAAKAVLAADELKDIHGSATNVDGKVTAKKADGTKVVVDVEGKGSGSEVTVNVGTLGDPALGADIARRIKTRAETKEPRP
jgi:hypothetical protein